LDDRFEHKGLDSWQQSLNEAALTDECSSILLFVIGSGRQAQHTRQFGFSDTVLRWVSLCLTLIFSRGLRSACGTSRPTVVCNVVAPYSAQTWTFRQYFYTV